MLVQVSEGESVPAASCCVGMVGWRLLLTRAAAAGAFFGRIRAAGGSKTVGVTGLMTAAGIGDNRRSFFLPKFHFVISI